MGIINKAMEWLDEEDEDVSFPVNHKVDLGVPEFLHSESEAMRPYTTEEIILNNVPGNKDLEEQKHLGELEEATKNFTEEEKKISAKTNDADIMFDELKYEFDVLQDFANHIISDVERLKQMINL